MEKNLPFQTIRPLPSPIRVPSRLWAHLRASADLFGKKWYYGINLQAIGFLVLFEICAREICEWFVYKLSETIEYVKN